MGSPGPSRETADLHCRVASIMPMIGCLADIWQWIWHIVGAQEVVAFLISLRRIHVQPVSRAVCKRGRRGHERGSSHSARKVTGTLSLIGSRQRSATGPPSVLLSWGCREEGHVQAWVPQRGADGKNPLESDWRKVALISLRQSFGAFQAGPGAAPEAGSPGSPRRPLSLPLQQPQRVLVEGRLVAAGGPRVM